MIWAGVALLAFVTLQRLAELALSERNTKRLLARGAYEAAPGHYPFIVTLHALWLAVLWFLGPGPPLQIIPLAIFAALQLMRVWVIATLGERWSSRMIILPGAPLVRRGPYRYLRHPNYAVVAGEIAVLPLVFGQWEIAAIFSLLNLLVLYERIRVENEALAERRTLD